jgi:ABC-2 type transport system permease protein
MWKKIQTLITKEAITVWRDKKSRLAILIPPIVQLLILVQAATLEVKNVTVAIYNQDNGWYSHELIERIHGSSYFKKILLIEDISALEHMVDTQQVLAAITIQQDFSRLLAAGQNAEIQFILDGRKANASQIVQGYLSEIIVNFNADIITLQNALFPLPINEDFRAWFNPNLIYIYYNAPCLIAILSMVIALTITALSVAREREMGTFDQLLVSPLEPWQMLVGKIVPGLLISIAESTVMMGIIIWLYGVPFNGSLILFYMGLLAFVLSIVGVGLFISSLVKTQQQAILGIFIFMVPTITLSGYATPVENMPIWLQPISWILPATHFFIIVKGVFLKDMSAMAVFMHTLPMLGIALVNLTAAVWMFKRRLE